ncbi:MAG TPA: M3 family metallopeptidase [Casimicrobium huifangae]|jgi:oligopeptidase A|uniref:M3 family metallopeptidase n=1 Tax=Casimicrobium huifangae TaxID=2591109 RepID=UPI0015F2B77E|nr:M3 family metallopeptidase [Casimicrobium huifangae]HOB02140.1 M3 family metallopeptidase [Casimicrobium huifangae]HQA33117.1 M3 family metallopeptidase [Casimicrobium huifangae]HQD64091.1 M3 family metallopeptidase [Casimicrobium huifangae]
MNPLLDFASLPRFSEVLPEHVNPAIEQLIADARTAVSVVEKAESITWQTVVEPLQDATERLGRAWGAVAHLNAVISSPALRDAHNTALPKVTQFFTELGLNRALFERYKALSEDAASLSDEQRALLAHELKDFRLSGIELEGQARERFAAIQEELAETQSKFEDNVLDATNAWTHDVPVADLAGVPADVVATAQAKAKEAGLADGVARLTLQGPCYLPVMQYAESAALRELMYRAYATRASDEGEVRFDNGAAIAKIMALRAEEAKLLGFQNYAEVSLVPKMANSPQQVLDFIRDIARRARPFAERDLAELRAFAAAELGIANLASPDVAFASEKLRQQRFAFSDEEVRQYFPEDRVLAGLFRVVESIYSVRIVEGKASAWHPDVRFFEVLDGSGSRIGEFYFDLYARDSKRGGAWADSARDRRVRNGQLQTPVAYMTCNFPAPVGDKPALFTHDDVITLFHEFGHGLHLLLTEVGTLGISGFGHVEWDAVELPSQFMENYCWEWDVLSHMTQHVETCEPLPRALFDKMLAAKNFQAGLGTLRQMEFALFDMRLHADNIGADRAALLKLLGEVRAEVAVMQPPAYNRMPWSFGHIFGGGYAAGYYSYKWAEVLSADAYSRFEEEGVLSPVAGNAFRKEVLGRGGSRDAMTNFVAFRGRSPTVDALLRHNGMVSPQ